TSTGQQRIGAEMEACRGKADGEDVYRSEPLGRKDANGREEESSGRGFSPCLSMNHCVGCPSFRNRIPCSPWAFQSHKVFLLLQARPLSTSCCVGRTSQV